MNFDACGTNTAVLENSGKDIFREFGGNNQRKYLSKSDNICKIIKALFQKRKTPAKVKIPEAFVNEILESFARRP